MDKEAKIAFVLELCANIASDVVKNVDKMPKKWDGIELRQYIADKATESSYKFSKDRRKRRYRDYYNSVIVNGL